MNLVVRFGVDACIPQPSEETCAADDTTSAGTHVDALADQRSGLNGSSENEAPEITVIRAGRQLPQSAIIELNTRSVKSTGGFKWQDQCPPLLLSSITHHFLALHENGTFQRVKKRELSTADSHHVDNSARTQDSFKKLVEALKVIQALVKEHGQRGRLSLVCQDGELKVYESTSEQGCLPESELERFGV